FLPPTLIPRSKATNFIYNVSSSSGSVFTFSTENILHRGADRLVRAVNTAQPATRPTHPFLEFTDCPFDMILSCFVPLDEGSPANPLIAGKRCKSLPKCERLRVRG